MSSTYKPTEHSGLKEDGSPDKRVGTGQFAQGQVDPTAAGKKGGSTNTTSNTGAGSAGGSGDYKPTEHEGLTRDGKVDGRVKQ